MCHRCDRRHTCGAIQHRCQQLSKARILVHALECGYNVAPFSEKCAVRLSVRQESGERER
jgi:hypothetical protein